MRLRNIGRNVLGDDAAAAAIMAPAESASGAVMAGEQEQRQSKGSWIRRLLEHPAYLVIAGAATIITIIGLPLSIYFFLAARQVPDLTYYVSPTRTAIVSNQSDQKLSVAYDGKQVHGDISSAQVTIWNAGTKPIRHSDFLTPITLTFPAHNPILDSKVLDVSRQLIDFKGGIENVGTGVLTLDWRILERNDGVKLQVIYVGEPDAKLVVDGAIIGQPVPSRRSMTPDERTNSPLIVSVVVGVGVAALSVMLLSFFRTILVGYLNPKRTRVRFEWAFFGIVSVITLGGVGWTLYMFWRLVSANYMNVPPFGF